MIAFVILLLTFVTAFYQYFRWQASYWRRRGVPGPAPRLYYGNFVELNNFNRPTAIVIHDWTEKYGQVYGYKEGVKNVLVTSDMNMIHDVFVKQFDNFYARRAAALSKDLDNDPRVHLFEARGSRWKRLRALSSPSFSISSLKKIRPIIEDSATKLIDLIETRHGDGVSFNVHRFYMEYTLDTICRMVLGQKESTLFNNHRIGAVQAIFLQNFDRRDVYLAVAMPPIAKILQRIASKVIISKKVRTFHHEVQEAVFARIQERDSNGAPETPRDFLDLFLDTSADMDFDNHGEFSTANSVTKALTVDEVISQAVVFLLAGYDTTSNALSYTTWMLSRHPEVMRRCQEEIDEVCTDQSISHEDLGNLRYLDAVCKETLRFFPLAARAIARTCMKDTVVGDYSIEKGTVVMADTYAIHFSKEIWGDDVNEFKPERWLDDDRRVSQLSFLTFGAGPRICIGMRLAVMEEKMALAHLLRRMDVLPDETVSDLTLIGSLTITPESVPIRVRVRQ